MDEYILRGDVLKRSVDCEFDGDFSEIVSVIPVESVYEIPAADVRPVVFCRDCIHYKLDPLEQIMACVKDADEIDGYYSGFVGYPAADWFCADGEREVTP